MNENDKLLCEALYAGAKKRLDGLAGKLDAPEYDSEILYIQEFLTLSAGLGYAAAADEMAIQFDNGQYFVHDEALSRQWQERADALRNGNIMYPDFTLRADRRDIGPKPSPKSTASILPIKRL